MRTTNQRFSSLRRQPPPHSALFPTSPFLQSHPSFHSNSKKHELKKGIAFSSSNQRCLTHLTFDPLTFFFFLPFKLHIVPRCPTQHSLKPFEALHLNSQTPLASFLPKVCVGRRSGEGRGEGGNQETRNTRERGFLPENPPLPAARAVQAVGVGVTCIP